MVMPGEGLPCLADGVELCDHGSYGLLAAPGGAGFLQLEPDEFAMMGAVDGSKSVDELVALFGPSVPELLEDMWAEGCLVGAPVPTPGRVTVTRQGLEFAGFDRVVRWLDARVGRFVFSRVGAVGAALVAVTGLGALAVAAESGESFTVGVTSPVLALVVLRVLGFVSIGLHESGHALVTVHYGRRVRRVGIGFYWGLLTFYVDATDAMFLPRRLRMMQAAAGVITEATLCGAAGWVALAGGDAMWALVLREFALLGLISVVLDSVPLLEFDGYWFLADALDRPTLRHDARRALADLVHGRDTSARLAVYGAASMAFGVVLMVAGYGAWWAVFGDLFHRLWAGGTGYKLLALYLVVPVVAVVAHLAAQPVLAVRARRSRRHEVTEVVV